MITPLDRSLAHWKPARVLAFALASLIVAALIPAHANAQVVFEYIGDNVYGTDISEDGTVVVGNTAGSFETFRWTAETGVQLLGRPTVPFLGGGAGTPDVSLDGTKVSASILGADSTYWTQGLWTLGSGWQETMPPLPADGGEIDNSYGSSWGLSGDGSTLVGLYWRPGQPGGLAHPSAWTSSSGVVDLGTAGGSGRASDVNEDGSVVVGWEERTDGAWRPTAWVNGTRVTLSDTGAFTEASAVTLDGTMIGGVDWVEATNRFVAAVWRWNGIDWVEEILGQLPGTAAGTFGLTIVNGITADGSVVVGYNRFSNPNNATGFMWNAVDGMINIETFLQDNGVVVDPDFNILTLSAITPGGRTLVGSGQMNVAPFTARTFLIHILDPADAPAELVGGPPVLRVYPNPVFDRATLEFDSAATGRVSISIHDVAGRSVRNFRGLADRGPYRIDWDGRNDHGGTVPSGIYFVRWSDGRDAGSRRITVTR